MTETVTGVAAIADQVDAFGEMFTAEALAPAQAAAEESVKVIEDAKLLYVSVDKEPIDPAAVIKVAVDPGAEPEALTIFNAPLPDVSNHDLVVVSIDPPGRNWVKDLHAAFYADPTPALPVYVPRGEKITQAQAEAFNAAYGDLIRERAEAVAERAAPFAVADSIVIHYLHLPENLMHWQGRSRYHRGYTEEYFVVASVTYQKSDGLLFTIPIHYLWETGEITPHFIASRVEKG